MKKRIILIASIAITNFNLLLSQSTSPAPYCAADFDDAQGFLVEDAINSVSFGTLTNTTNAQFAFPHYVFYNNLPVPNFSKGSQYTLTVKFDVHGGTGYGVWIDYNQNNIFDASEKVGGSTGSAFLNISSNTTVTHSITIPTSALSGITRMRVRIVEDDAHSGGTDASVLACNASTSTTDVMDWGETEDYNINITQSSVGINELNDHNNIIIYPNPASTLLTLNQHVSGDLAYNIVDLTGKTIQTGTVNNSEKQIRITSLSEGIYFLQLFNGSEPIGMQKFIKTAE